MARQLWRRGYRVVAVAAVGALALAGCASSDADSGASDGSAGRAADGRYEIGYVGERSAGDPVDGGTVTFGSYGFPATLDPTQNFSGGTAGTSELAAIYDTLVRFDSESQEFVPQLAESVEASGDGMMWTVKLPQGATFSDGTPLNSAAVKWSIDRYTGAKRDQAQLWLGTVAGVETPDDTTVEITLQRPWADFPILLSMGAGLIMAPSSMASGTFTPIGAGPFSVARFAPNEVLELTPRADYVGGAPHLASLKFVPTPASRANYESMRSGQLNAGFLMRDTEVIDEALDAGMGGYVDLQGQGVIGTINQREGRPGADVRVRQAIAYGVDPEALNQRSSNGHNPYGSSIFPDGSKWHNADVPGVQYDPEKAKQLLAEAKADGYDGKLTYAAINEESARQAALGVQAALNAIGFDVEIVYATSVTDLTKRVYVDKDFDLARSGNNLVDAAPYLRLFGLNSQAGTNAGGYNSPEMDELLTQLQTAPDDAAKQDAIDAIQTLANETVPSAVWAPSVIYVAWSPDVHGVNMSADGIAHFGEAWVSN